MFVGNGKGMEVSSQGNQSWGVPAQSWGERGNETPGTLQRAENSQENQENQENGLKIKTRCKWSQLPISPSSGAYQLDKSKTETKNQTSHVFWGKKKNKQTES